MKIGYARVSQDDQNLALQLEALEKEKCRIIFSEKVSRVKSDARKELDKAVGSLEEGDILVVWALDRLGGELFAIYDVLNRIFNKKAHLKVLSQKIDTSVVDENLGGFNFTKILIHNFALVAELEMTLRKNRTSAGRNKKNGRVGGRKPGMSDESIKTANKAAKLYLAKDEHGKPLHSVRDIATLLKISLRTLYKYLKYKNVVIGKRDF